jgi:hypothetical protein
VTDEEEKLPTPLLAPAQGLPDVINTEELFEKALVSLAQALVLLPSTPREQADINSVLVHI